MEQMYNSQMHKVTTLTTFENSKEHYRRVLKILSKPFTTNLIATIFLEGHGFVVNVETIVALYPLLFQDNEIKIFNYSFDYTQQIRL
jgi:hypothetical protein